MNQIAALEFARTLVRATPKAYDNDDLFGDMELMACAWAVLQADATTKSREVVAAIAALQSDADYKNRSGRGGYWIFADGSVGTVFQGDDYSYPSESDFLDDFSPF